MIAQMNFRTQILKLLEKSKYYQQL